MSVNERPNSAESEAPEQVGTVVAVRGGYGQWRAVCSSCSWSWQGEKSKAVEHMQGHAALVHPAPIPVYRRPTPPADRSET